MFSTVVVTVGLSSLLALAYTLSYDRLGIRARLAFDPVAYGLAGLNFGVITLGVLGVLVVSTEYSSGLMRTSLSAVPRRSRLLAAKCVVLARDRAGRGADLVVPGVLRLAGRSSRCGGSGPGSATRRCCAR